MANTERFSISLDTDRASLIRELVEQGKYPSISSVFDAAADVLLEREAIRQEWWDETVRRCEEAEKHPERLLDHDAFFRQTRKEIGRRKQILRTE
jgi:Arc/MetJ-type ribon-helix-helix transcriptional regulator